MNPEGAISKCLRWLGKLLTNKKLFLNVSQRLKFTGTKSVFFSCGTWRFPGWGTLELQLPPRRVWAAPGTRYNQGPQALLTEAESGPWPLSHMGTPHFRLYFFLTRGLFSVLFRIQTFGYFPVIILLLISSLISLWPEINYLILFQMSPTSHYIYIFL